MNTLYRKIESSLPLTIVLLLAINAVLYCFFILKVPQFFADDYYIFHVIKSNPDSLITLNIYEKYSLALRPVAYFYFWMQNQLFETNSLLIKSFSLILLQIYSGIIVIALKYILDFFKITRSNFLLLLAGIFISLHPDYVVSVLWISDVNELLMSMFYVLAVIVFFAYAKNDIRPNLWSGLLLLLCYLLSLFSKQQSLHLPLLFLFILFTNKNRFGKEQYKALFRITLLAMVFFVFGLIINIKVYFLHSVGGDVSLADTILKKPFALAGNIILIFLPKQGAEIYNYFIQQKLLAGILLGTIIVSSSIVLIKRKSLITPAFKMLLFILIVSFPRMIAPGGDRLNSLLVFLMITLFLIVGTRFYKTSFSILILLVFNVLYSSIEKVSLFEQAVSRHNSLCRSLARFDTDSGRIKYISYFSSKVPTSHSYYFYKNGVFGKDTLIVQSGIVASDYRDWFRQPQNIICNLSYDTLSVRSVDPTAEVLLDRDFSPDIKTMEKGKIRGYSRIRILVSHTVYKKGPIFITPVDTTWSVL